jgi:hypothetical protein
MSRGKKERKEKEERKEKKRKKSEAKSSLATKPFSCISLPGATSLFALL